MRTTDVKKRPSPARPLALRGVSATEAAKSFGRLVDRVREEQAVYHIERGGVPVARIGPVDRSATCTLSQFKELAATLVAVGHDHADAADRALTRHNRPRARRNPWGR
jgi:antitoxin (DNA-binding transcriptional repressor) of toxin-antitoxin stability system